MPADALSIVQKFFPEVQHVEDSDSHLDVEVTARDNANAQRRSHKTCAMAVACKRKMHLDGVIISLKTAYLIKNKKATRFRLGESISREVVTFDRNGEFASGDYKLLKPGPSHCLGKHQGGQGGHSKKSSHRKVAPYHFTTGVRTVLGSKMAAE